MVYAQLVRAVAAAGPPTPPNNGPTIGENANGVQANAVMRRSVRVAGSVEQRAAPAPAPPPYRAPKRSLPSCAAFAADPLFDNGHLVLPSRPWLCDNLPDASDNLPDAKAGIPWHHLSTMDQLDPSLLMTDERTCAMDAFNAAVGRQIMTPENLVENGWADQSAGLRYEDLPFQRCMHKNGYQVELVRVKPKRSGSKRKLLELRVEKIMGQQSGSFIVEFRWRTDVMNSDYHAVAINCTTRKLTCNTLGVVPFQMSAARESAATHAEVVQNLHIHRVLRVWRVRVRR